MKEKQRMSEANVITDITIIGVPRGIATPKKKRTLGTIINEYVKRVTGQWGPT